MLEALILLGLCALAGLASVLVVVWLLVTGSLLSLDGLAFAFISLTLGAFFVFNIGWSLYTGELRQLLAKPAKESAGKESAPPSKA